MIRAGKRSKDASPAPSRGSSLRGASASEAKRTVLNLENDDWSDEDTPHIEVEPDNIINGIDFEMEGVKPLDMAVVAQMMNSTVRKRSPKVRSQAYCRP